LKAIYLKKQRNIPFALLPKFRSSNVLIIIISVVGSWKFFGFPKPNRRTEPKNYRFTTL